MTGIDPATTAAAIGALGALVTSLAKGFRDTGFMRETRDRLAAQDSRLAGLDAKVEVLTELVRNGGNHHE